MHIFCQSCGQQLTITQEHLGQLFNCPTCGVEQTAPNATAALINPPKLAAPHTEQAIESKLQDKSAERTKKGTGGKGGWAMGFAVFGVFVVNLVRNTTGISLGAIPTMIVVLLFGAIGWAIDDENAKKKNG
jgi:hypothetical protein